MSIFDDSFQLLYVTGFDPLYVFMCGNGCAPTVTHSVTCGGRREDGALWSLARARAPFADKGPARTPRCVAEEDADRRAAQATGGEQHKPPVVEVREERPMQRDVFRPA